MRACVRACEVVYGVELIICKWKGERWFGRERSMDGWILIYKHACVGLLNCTAKIADCGECNFT